MKELLISCKEVSQKLMPFLGQNKQREIERLLFEIAKRDKIAPSEILPKEFTKNFEQAKKYLLSKRYKTKVFTGVYLPKLDLNFVAPAVLEDTTLSPKNIFIEDLSLTSALVKRVQENFPNASYKIFKNKFPKIESDYSKRKENLIIFKEKFDFVKPCPCTKNANCCGYNLINLGFGCLYECNYCFLQQYQNLSAIALPSNIDDFLTAATKYPFREGPFPVIRIGSGEFTDSLLFDSLTQYSKDIVNFFKNREEYFEFKTKSCNIANLLNMEAPKNIVVGWSVNPQNIIDDVEPLTPSLSNRIEAAAKLARHGYKVAFHFDPVILHDNWQENYKNTIEEIASKIPSDKVVWISVGTLRFNRELKKFIECRFPNNTILDEDFFISFDGKMRYREERRKEVYDFIRPLLGKYFAKSKIYLCMEK